EAGGELVAEVALERLGDRALGVAVELQPAGADDRHLAREPLLEDELGLEPADELGEPLAHDGDRAVVVRAQARGEGLDGDAGRGDLVHRRAGEALAREQLHRRVANRDAGRALLALPQTSHGPECSTPSI